jgi:hypothetical protein
VSEPPAPPADVPADPAAQPEAPPADPVPPPEPVPAPAPDLGTPPAEEPPPSPPMEQQEPAADRGGSTATESGRDRDSTGAAPTPEPVLATVAAPAQPVAAPAPVAAAPEALPLGWDVYDDAVFGETVEDDGGAGGLGQDPRAAINGLGTLGAIGTAVERGKHRDAKPVSRADPMSGGGSGPGGSGPGPGPSLGLFGAGGGAGAGVALMTLLGMACGWFLLAPDRKRAFLTSTATWRPSAYVPPIEHPG